MKTIRSNLPGAPPRRAAAVPRPSRKSARGRFLLGAVMALGIASAGAQEPVAPAKPSGEMESMPGMDHGRMNHGAMPGMDQGDKSGTSQEKGHDMNEMDQGGGMDMGSMSMQGGSAPADARDPNAYSDGYGFGPLPPPRMGDMHSFYGVLMDRLERVRTRDNSSTEYDLQAWYGRDFNRAVLKAEGEADGGKLQEARTELLWGHALATYWDSQLGLRHDSGTEPSRQWLAFGFQGLAPYWFELEATAYVGEQGRSALRFAGEYELLLTQKLILQPRVETNIYGKRDPAREIGSGLSDLVAGLRLRYEIRREFAPYVGIERSGTFGGSADFARAAGKPTRQTRVVAGLRFWF
ncbi:MAG: copper resistance protein B [Sulfuricaulis sp.]